MKICDKYSTNSKNHNYFKFQKYERFYEVNIQKRYHEEGEIRTKFVHEGVRKAFLACGPEEANCSTYSEDIEKEDLAESGSSRRQFMGNDPGHVS